MELRHIKELMAAMGRTGTKRIKFKKDDFEIELEREDSHRPSSQIAEHLVKGAETNAFLNDLEQHRVNISPSRSDKRFDKPASEGSELEEEGMMVTSPMVGTFYLSPSPDEPSFVKVGDKVNENTVVCIIEAMKVMNEVKAGVSGVVAEILIENGHPVEFGTKLFRVVES